MTRDDYVIVCGDFGYWRNEADLDLLAKRNFTVLFVDGNHEDFDGLKKIPTVQWHGGRVQFIRENIIHLMRGQNYIIEGKKFLTMGGASSHDISDGILELYDPNLNEKIRKLRSTHRNMFRINHHSWWKEELPSEEEYSCLEETISKNNEYDFVITHCCPSSIQSLLVLDSEKDRLTECLDDVFKRIEFRHWYFGHYHANYDIAGTNCTCLYNEIRRII